MDSVQPVDLTPTSKGERLTPTSKGERRGQIQGQLRQDGKPVAGATVWIEGTALLTQTDPSGQFEIREAPLDQPFYLLAQSSDATGKAYASRSQQEIPSATGKIQLSELTLGNTGSVAGQVSLADQAPPDGVDIFIPGTAFIAKTDAQGAFALPNLPTGTYTLQASKSGYFSTQTEVTVRAGEVSLPAELRLTPQSSPTSAGTVLSGRITSGGQPLPATWVSLTDSSLRTRALTLSNAQGFYRLELPLTQAEDLEVLAYKEGYTFQAESLKLTPQRTETRDLELASQLLQLGRLNAQISDCQGQPLSSALLQLSPPPALGGLPFSDNRGQVSLSGLLPGNYLVTAAKGRLRQSQGMRLENRQTGADGQPGAVVQLQFKLGACSGAAE